MRTDKFLQLSRLVKQRSTAKLLCDSGKITINGTAVKASHELSVGDTFTLESFGRSITVRVAEVPATKNVSKQRAAELYVLEKEEIIAT